MPIVPNLKASFLDDGKVLVRSELTAKTTRDIAVEPTAEESAASEAIIERMKRECKQPADES